MLIVVLLLLAVFFCAGVLGSNPDSVQIHWPKVIGLILCLGMAACLFFWKDHLRKEYDYFLKGDVLEVHAVLNRRRRKQLCSLNIKRIQAAAQIDAAKLASARKQPGLQILDCRVEAGGYYLYYSETNLRRMLLLNLDEQMAALMHRQLGDSVWQSIEGE
jgi:hypothetical protein